MRDGVHEVVDVGAALATARDEAAGDFRLRQLARSWYIGAFHLPVLAPLFWRLYLGPRWGGVLRRLEGVRAEPAPTITRDAVRGISLYRANIRPVMRSPRHRLASMPVQVIQPTRDRYIRTEPLDLERWVPALRRRRIAAGHWAPLSHPAPIARRFALAEAVAAYQAVASGERGRVVLLP